MSSGQNAEAILQQVSAKMQITPEQLKATLEAVRTGDTSQVPQIVMEKALAHGMSMQAAQRTIAVQRSEAMTAPGAHTHASSHVPNSSSAGLLDEEESQSWLSLYRSVYLRKADMFIGPVLTALAASLFWAQVLPFWVALWLMPSLMLLSVHFVLAKGKYPHLTPSF